MAYFGNEPAKVAVKVGSGVITATELADDSITTADIIDDAITRNQLDEDGTGFQVGTLGVGAAVSGGHALLVSGTSSISGAATFAGDVYFSGTKRLYLGDSGALGGSIHRNSNGQVDIYAGTTKVIQLTAQNFSHETGNATFAGDVLISKSTTPKLTIRKLLTLFNRSAHSAGPVWQGCEF